MEFLKISFDLQDTFSIAYKGGCDEINLLLHTKPDVFFILLCNRGETHRHIGNIDPFSFAQFAAVDHSTYNLVPTLVFYLQFNQAVINQNPAAGLYIICQSVISNGNFLFVSFNFLRSQDKCLPFL